MESQPHILDEVMQNEIDRKNERGKWSEDVEEISLEDFFDDAFRPISRDGADNIGVMLRLQKAFISLETIHHPAIKEAAIRHSKEAYNRAETAIEFNGDLDTLKAHCLFSKKL